MAGSCAAKRGDDLVGLGLRLSGVATPGGADHVAQDLLA